VALAHPSVPPSTTTAATTCRRSNAHPSCPWHSPTTQHPNPLFLYKIFPFHTQQFVGLPEEYAPTHTRSSLTFTTKIKPHTVTHTTHTTHTPIFPNTRSLAARALTHFPLAFTMKQTSTMPTSRHGRCAHMSVSRQEATVTPALCPALSLLSKPHDQPREAQALSGSGRDRR